MNKAALNVYKEIREQGTQAAVVDTMQTRMELYDFLGYHEYEKLDRCLQSKQARLRTTKIASLAVVPSEREKLMVDKNSVAQGCAGKARAAQHCVPSEYRARALPIAATTSQIWQITLVLKKSRI